MREVRIHMIAIHGGVQISAGEVVGKRWFRADKIVLNSEVAHGGVDVLEFQKKRCLQDLSLAVAEYEASR